MRRLAADGLEAWKQVIESGYEGYVAKDGASAYQGGTTRWWLKVKQKAGAMAASLYRQLEMPAPHDAAPPSTSSARTTRARPVVCSTPTAAMFERSEQ